jgi:hypothetical protein
LTMKARDTQFRSKLLTLLLVQALAA